MFDKLTLRKAIPTDADEIWEILQQAIQKRKEEGSKQWQEGYPNPTVIANDIANEFGYIIINSENNTTIGYVVISDAIEPAYDNLIEGNWLSNEQYIVVHRLAVSQDIKIKGIGTWVMQEAEKIAKNKHIKSIKIDTNFDNESMLRILQKLNYTYCGEVVYRGDYRKAFEKLIA